jgi:hypothetical protein
MTADYPVYTIVGASVFSSLKLDEAVTRAARWLNTFDNVWITVVARKDVVLHFLRDDRGVLTVDVTRNQSTITVFLGRSERTQEIDHEKILSTIEQYC